MAPSPDDCLSTQQNTCLEDCCRKASISDLSAMCGTEDRYASMMNNIASKKLTILSYIAFCISYCLSYRSLETQITSDQRVEDTSTFTDQSVSEHITALVHCFVSMDNSLRKSHHTGESSMLL